MKKYLILIFSFAILLSVANVANAGISLPFPGCTDPVALNYNPLANIDDGSCIFLPTDIEQCKKYDWEIFEIFRNQGDCVSFIATDGRKLIKGN